MVNRSGRLGTAAETAVVNYLRANGFAQAERRRLRGAEDWGDLTGTPGLCWEVKGGETARAALEDRSGLTLAGWLGETERERLASRSDLGLLVVQRRGVNYQDAGRWLVVIDVHDLVDLVLSARGDLAVDAGAPRPAEPIPVRVELQHVVRFLRGAGYGDPLDALDAPEAAPLQDVSR